MTATPDYPEDLLYNSDHDWARVEGDEATFGITWYAQDQLGEVVFVDPAELGAEVVKGEAYLELESVKAVSEVIAPLSGTIIAVNEDAVREPDLINRSPHEEGWLIRIKIADSGERADLLSAAAYGELLG